MTATEQIPRASSDEQARLDDLYSAFAAAHLAPLWLQREGLMPAAPQPDAQPALWRWSTLLPLAERSGALVPVGRGGERRAIALAMLTPGMHFHEHHNPSDHPMAWIDGLDIPFVRQVDAGFFEFGPDELATRETPAASRNETARESVSR